MSDVILLVHRIPFPPDKGDKIRSWHLLRHLAREHRVHLGAFVDDPADNRYRSELEACCEAVFLRPVGGWRSRLGALAALSHGRSLGVGYYADDEMRDWVSGVLASRDIRSVIAFSSTMAQYLPLTDPGSSTLIADFVDVDSDKWRQYVEESSWPRRWLYQYEARALARWEAGVLDQVDAVCVVSQAESEIVPGRHAGNRDKIAVLPNGVDYDFFDPEAAWSDPFDGNSRALVFTGAMDYYANVDGVCWFADGVWDAVRSEHPDAEFYIVGSKPTAAVSALAGRPGITVTGRVPDVRPYLAHAAAVVAPLRLARGVQNKVLEALSMNRPVIATTQALRGLDGMPPRSAVAASSAEDFAREVIERLNSPSAVSDSAGREFVRSRYDWTRNLAQLGRWIPADSEVRDGTVG
ncbi:TIGR03087 family PEP-CTERM/XrtA system glycosyltransferase [Lentisalinibacter salinarum]|uniref:TIGR03087 family PEP-CTERM/XrtA system glycosyltransferase n=1 Tax=Lentisalinibacter salinarum TaxID=2992239 RepID=UPI003867065C